MKEYVVLFEQGPTTWGAYVPDLPGCIAADETFEETGRLIHEAIEFYIEGLRLDGEPVPELSHLARQVAVAA